MNVSTVIVIADQCPDAILADTLAREVGNIEGEQARTAMVSDNQVLACVEHWQQRVLDADDPIEYALSLLNDRAAHGFAYGFHPDESGTVLYGPVTFWQDR